jgi:hypothetical protein
MTAARERLVDRTGLFSRLMGLGALLLLAVAASVDPSSTPTASAVALPARPPARFADQFPAYPGTRFIPMGVIDANGTPFELSVATSEATPSQVVEFFGREFQKAGSHPDFEGGAEEATVSYYDSATGALVSVHALPTVAGGKKATLIVSSIAEGPDRLKLSTETPTSLPTKDGTVTVMRLDERTLSSGTSTITQIVPGTPAEVAETWRAQVRDLGWSVVESRTGENKVQMLHLVREGERAMVTISPMVKEGEPESVVATVMEKTP